MNFELICIIIAKKQNYYPSGSCQPPYSSGWVTVYLELMGERYQQLYGLYWFIPMMINKGTQIPDLWCLKCFNAQPVLQIKQTKIKQILQWTLEPSAALCHDKLTEWVARLHSEPWNNKILLTLLKELHPPPIICLTPFSLFFDKVNIRPCRHEQFYCCTAVGEDQQHKWERGNYLILLSPFNCKSYEPSRYWGTQCHQCPSCWYRHHIWPEQMDQTVCHLYTW